MVYLVSVNWIKVVLDSGAVLCLYYGWSRSFKALSLLLFAFHSTTDASHSPRIEQIVFNLDPKHQTVMNDKGSVWSRKELVARQWPLALHEYNCLPSVYWLEIGKVNNKRCVPAAPCSWINDIIFFRLANQTASVALYLAEINSERWKEMKCIYFNIVLRQLFFTLVNYVFFDKLFDY